MHIKILHIKIEKEKIVINHKHYINNKLLDTRNSSNIFSAIISTLLMFYFDFMVDIKQVKYADFIREFI